MASIQLHSLGYDRVPISVSHLLENIETLAPSMDGRIIETTYSILSMLPYNSCHYKNSRFFHDYILTAMDKNMVYLQMIPFDRMTKAELDSILEKYCQKWMNMENLVFYSNVHKMNFFFHQPSFIEYHLSIYLKPVDFKRPVIINLSSYISEAIKLLDYFRHDKNTTDLIVKQLKEVFRMYSEKFGEENIMTSNSLCNIFHLRLLQKELSIS